MKGPQATQSPFETKQDYIRPTPKPYQPKPSKQKLLIFLIPKKLPTKTSLFSTSPKKTKNARLLLANR